MDDNFKSRTRRFQSMRASDNLNQKEQKANVQENNAVKTHEIKQDVAPNKINHIEVRKESSSKFRDNPWMMSTFVLVVILIGFIAFSFAGRADGNIVAGDVAAGNLVSFIKSQNNGQTQSDVKIVSTEQEGQLYKITVNYQGQDIPVYVSLDGKYLIADVVPLDANLIAPNGQDDTSNKGSVEVDIGESPLMGDENAPVTIIEFSDFQCPFCGRFFSDTLPQIEEKYIKTGKVKLVYKDFPLSNIHPNAEKAAEAARCVREQKGDEGYFKMHDLLFENQQDLSVENYKKWARTLGVVGAKFDTCLDDGKYASDVQDDFAYGERLGVSGTPAFFIDGKTVTGAQPYSVFEQVIEAELSGSGTSI